MAVDGGIDGLVVPKYIEWLSAIPRDLSETPKFICLYIYIYLLIECTNPISNCTTRSLSKDLSFIISSSIKSQVSCMVDELRKMQKETLNVALETCIQAAEISILKIVFIHHLQRL